MLSNSQAGQGRTVKQEQEEISRNHVHAFIPGSVHLLVNNNVVEVKLVGLFLSSILTWFPRLGRPAGDAAAAAAVLPRELHHRRQAVHVGRNGSGWTRNLDGTVTKVN